MGKIVNDIIERRNEYRLWAEKNVWPEWVDVWRMIKCRTKPIMRTNIAGRKTDEEDTSRTNVDMGLANLVYRKNVARLSARPYSLRVIGGSDPTVAPRFSAKLAQDYDRSNESQQDIRVRMAAEALGIGISVCTYDEVKKERTYRKAIMRGNDVVYRDRASLMRYQGAKDDEIEQATKSEDDGGYGDSMSDKEIADFMGKNGSEITVSESVPKYEGPVIKAVFPGRIYYSPYVRMLSESDFVGQDFEETDLWLKKMLKVTYDDPDTGKKVNAFDPKVVAQVLKLGPKNHVQRGSAQDLEDMFRAVERKEKEADSSFPPSMRKRKRFNIVVEHSQDKYGRLWITWVCEDYKDAPLGKMPYPCDTYGNWLYTAEVPLPDLIDAIGDSTPRLMRFLLTMYNVQTAQNFDYVTQSLRKMILAKTGVNFSEEMTRFGNFDLYHISDPNAVKPFEIGSLPPGAFERGSNLLQLLFMFEPALSGIAAGTDANPMAGKTATTSLLAAKAADVLLQQKVDGRDLYLKQIGMLKLWMYQKMAESKWSDTTTVQGGGEGEEPQQAGAYAWQVGAKYFGPELQKMMKESGDMPPEWALSDRYGKTTAIQLDPMEIQEDLEVEPESGSYMAVNDQLKQDAVGKLSAIASQTPPGILDPRKLVRFALGTVPGIDNPDDFILPEPTGPPQPPPPHVSLNIGLAGKMEDQPQLTAEVLQRYGIQPTPDLIEQSQGNTLKRMSSAADHATNLLEKPDAEDAAEGQATPKAAAAE